MRNRRVRPVVCGLLVLLSLCGARQGRVFAADPYPCSASRLSEGRTITDMAGRKVTVPCQVLRVATVGSVPVINSYLFALGQGEKIVSGLPYFARTKRWRLQTAVAPHLSGKPELQGQDRAISKETLHKIRPDVVFTMDTFAIRALKDTGIPVVFLEWRDESDVRDNMRLLGDILSCTPMSDRYLRYFDGTMDRVRRAVKDVPEKLRPRALFLDLNRFTTPLSIADWWITQAGGISVTAGMARNENLTYSREQVLLWNPDILFVSSPDQVDRVYLDERLAAVNAVRNRRVHAVPVGVHPWGHRTAEQPLVVLWAAKVFFPDRLSRVNIEDELRAFYRRFFRYELTNHDIRSILSGE